MRKSACTTGSLRFSGADLPAVAPLFTRRSPQLRFAERYPKSADPQNPTNCPDVSGRQPGEIRPQIPIEEIKRKTALAKDLDAIGEGIMTSLGIAS